MSAYQKSKKVKIALINQCQQAHGIVQRILQTLYQLMVNRKKAALAHTDNELLVSA